MSKKILIVAVMMVFATAGLATAQPRGTGPWHDRNLAVDHERISALDLTPEQTEKVRSLSERFHGDMAPLRNKKFQCMTELKLLWMQMKPDVEKIKAKEKERYELGWQMKEKMTDYRLSFRKILTSEQLSKFLAQRSSGCFNPHGKDRCRDYRDGRCGKGKNFRQ